MKSTGVGDTAYLGPEAEFFIFDDVRFDQTANSGFYFVDSVEGIWNSGSDEGPNLGYKPRHKEGYFPVPPTDTMEDLRTEMVTIMQKCGIHIEAQHHEVATGGQGEIDMRFAPLVEQADKVMLFKYIVKNPLQEYFLAIDLYVVIVPLCPLSGCSWAKLTALVCRVLGSSILAFSV